MQQPSRTPSKKRFVVAQRHVPILRALHRYERLTAEQTRRVLYDEDSKSYSQENLLELFRHGYVDRVQIGRAGTSGSGPFVYSLDRRGRQYLLAMGLDVPRLRQSDMHDTSDMHRRHSVAVVDVLILADLLCRADASFQVAGMRGERALKAMAVRVTMPDGTRRIVAPDAWLDLRRTYPDGAILRACVAVEVDNGTEWQVAWRKKVRALLAYDAGPYTDAFDTDLLTIAVVARNPGRQEQLRRWTGAELVSLGAEERADLFRFGVMPEDRADARGFFLTPHWTIPGAAASVPLIAGREEGGA
jgi:hypothetical protein